MMVHYAHRFRAYSQPSMWKKGAECAAHSREALLRIVQARNILLTMIIACPACNTRYVVPDSAIGVEGRTVRCAKCRHSWFQDGEEITIPSASEPASADPQARPGFSDTHVPEGGPAAAAKPVPQAKAPRARDEEAPKRQQAEVRPTPPPTAAPAPVKSAAEPEPEPIRREPTVVETAPPPLPERDAFDDHSPFEREPPFRARRNPLKIWTAAAAVFALLAVGTVMAVSYYGLPDWVPVSRPTFGANEPDLVLDFPAAQQDRRTLPNGTEFFGASGKITNVGRETRRVPSILIVMRDQRERPVYSWEVVPPKQRLAPGESVQINEAVTNVPKSATVAEIGWKPS